MSDEKRRWPRSIAVGVARELCSVLNPLCERLIVAGSLRRGKHAWDTVVSWRNATEEEGGEG